MTRIDLIHALHINLDFSPAPDILITGGWDSKLNVYDPRASTPLVASHQLPSRVYSMDTKNDKLVVAMAERNVYVYDVRKLEEPEQKRESALKYMTRKVACMTDGKGQYRVPTSSLSGEGGGRRRVSGERRRLSSLLQSAQTGWPVTLRPVLENPGWTSCSIEGRIAVDYYSPEDQAKKYAYRCHRATVDGQDVVYPINALAYHPMWVLPLGLVWLQRPLADISALPSFSYNSFCSGGSDATVSIWDQVAKKRMKAYPKFPNSISALACSPDGTWLAVGYGYGWDEGELPADAGASKGEVGCLLRAVGDDVKPKVKAWGDRSCHD
jgi:cell cycle arrest protein BUB3